MHSEMDSCRVFHKNQNIRSRSHELCYEYISTSNPKVVRYCIFDTIHKTVTMERCEGSYFDGHEMIALPLDVIDYTVDNTPDEIRLSKHHNQVWMPA